jgi:hypothetical protein
MDDLHVAVDARPVEPRLQEFSLLPVESSVGDNEPLADRGRRLVEDAPSLEAVGVSDQHLMDALRGGNHIHGRGADADLDDVSELTQRLQISDRQAQQPEHMAKQRQPTWHLWDGGGGRRGHGVHR